MTAGRGIQSFYRMKRKANIWEQNNLPQYLVLSYFGNSGPLRSKHQGGIRQARDLLGLRRIKGRVRLGKEMQAGKGD